MNSKGVYVTGFVHLGTESDAIDKLCGVNNPVIATHVLQMVFLGYTRFRFPVTLPDKSSKISRPIHKFVRHNRKAQ